MSTPALISRIPKPTVTAATNLTKKNAKPQPYKKDPRRVPTYIQIKRDPPTPVKMKRKKQYDIPKEILESMKTPLKNTFTQNKAKEGLFHAEKNFGFTRSKSKVKTNRSWQPNYQTKNIFSQILDEPFKIQVTARMLRTIDKYGGIDRFLLYTANHKIGDTTQDPITKQFIGNKALHVKSRILAKIKYADEAIQQKIDDLNISAARISLQ